mgnify:CR=1 FL=1
MVQNADGIAYWAWKKSSIKILNSIATAKTASVEIGPNSIPDYNNIGFIQNKAIPYPIGNAGGFRG